jgi:hypothetical protein
MWPLASYSGADVTGRFPIGVSIIDALMVPADIAPGEYVLGFRYDCEMTAQVWSSCADITITNAAATAAHGQIIA